MLNFIRWCLTESDNERPSAEDLLKSVFLNDLESEENNHPISLDTNEFKEYQKSIHSDAYSSPRSSKSTLKYSRKSTEKSRNFSNGKKSKKLSKFHVGSEKSIKFLNFENNFVKEFYIEAKDNEIELKRIKSYKFKSSKNLSNINGNAHNKIELMLMVINVLIIRHDDLILLYYLGQKCLNIILIYLDQ
jgi:cobalamin biosynthesis protein CobT